MKGIMKNSILELDTNSRILAGIEFKMRYLGSGELSKSGGTDDEIARVIHDIHSLYAQRKTSIKKAREVVVFVDSQRINVYTKDEEEALLIFPLTQVRDVTTCLDQPPYSKTCVLVARRDNEPLYKAYVFYCKSEQKAVEFYQTASLAFQIGFQLLEKFGPFAETADDGTAMVVWNGFKNSTGEKDIPVIEITEHNDGLSERYVEGNFPTEEDLRAETFAHNDRQDGTPDHQTNERTTTVRIPTNNSGSAKWKKEGELNLDLGVETSNNNLNQSKLAVYIETVEERSRFLISRWFRNSYRKFKKISRDNSTDQSEDSVQY